MMPHIFTKASATKETYCVVY